MTINIPVGKDDICTLCDNKPTNVVSYEREVNKGLLKRFYYYVCDRCLDDEDFQAVLKMNSNVKIEKL